MARRSWCGLLLATTALTLGACSADGPRTASPAPAGQGDTGTPDPCELITDDEASAALGQPAGAKEVFGTVERECQIAPAAGMEGYLNIRIAPGDASSYERARQTMSETFPDTYRDLDGVGDAAFTIGNEVTVLTGGYLIVFFISVGAPGEDIDERALMMARAGVARA